MHKHRFRIQFQWVLHKENKEADGACKAACTSGGAVVVLDNTASLSKGAVNLVAHLTACVNICACDNSNMDNDGSMECDTLREE